MPSQGNMMGPQGPMQGGMMGAPPRPHGNMPNNYGMGNMHGPPGNMQGGPGNMQGPHGNMQGPPYMQHQVGGRGTSSGPVPDEMKARSHPGIHCLTLFQGQNMGPAMHGMGQQGPNSKGKVTEC